MDEILEGIRAVWSRLSATTISFTVLLTVRGGNDFIQQITSDSVFGSSYINKILSDWHERGLKTPEAVEKFLADMKQKQKDIKNIEKRTGYTNYEQRSYSNLSDLYANNFDINNN